MSKGSEEDLIPLALKFAKRIEPFWQYKSKQPIGYQIPHVASSREKRDTKEGKTASE